jgi:succinyl-diaminopimelate desuccinylase
MAGFVDLARESLAIPSTADRPDQLWRALDHCLGVVGTGFTVERFESNGKPSALVYAAPVRPAEFRVILNAHLDVVPADPAQFRPYVLGDRLYGRGAHDMKVSALVLAEVFRDCAGWLPYHLGLQLVTDEEEGGRDGTAHQIDRGVLGRFVIAGEQSGLELVTDAKGFVRVTLRARGVAAHSAYPWLGDNAVLKLTDSVTRLIGRYPVPAAEAWRTTVNVARLDTTTPVFNQVPADAVAWLDIRFPAEDVDFTDARIQDLILYLESFCDPGVRATIEHPEPPHHADPAGPDLLLLRKAVMAQGFPGGYLRKHGSGDVRFYSQRGVQAIAFGIGGAGQHGPAEYADLTTVGPYRRALTEFLTELGRSDPTPAEEYTVDVTG